MRLAAVPDSRDRAEAGRASRAEGISNPLDGRAPGRTVDGHHVEPARTVVADAVSNEVVFRRRCESRLLARVHALQASAEPATPTPSHLDENQGPGVTHDQIDLASPAPIVPADEDETPVGQETFRFPLGFPTGIR